MVGGGAGTGHGASLMLGWDASRAGTALGKEWITESPPARIPGKASRCCSCTRTWVCC